VVYLVAYDVLYAVGMKWIWRTLRAPAPRDVAPSADIVVTVPSALEAAAAIYVKPVKCLQRAVAVTWFLRRRGYACVMVVGAHVARKEGHAWVEAGDQVIGDPRHLRRFFCALTRA
jgi:Transglutaminase-like superfamily